MFFILKNNNNKKENYYFIIYKRKMKQQWNITLHQILYPVVFLNQNALSYVASHTPRQRHLVSG